MSSFSSVVQKPGKKIVPKAAPRRNVQRKRGQDVTGGQEIPTIVDPLPPPETLPITEVAQAINQVAHAKNAEIEVQGQAQTDRPATEASSTTSSEREPRVLHNNTQTTRLTSAPRDSQDNDPVAALPSGATLIPQPGARNSSANRPDISPANTQVEVTNPDRERTREPSVDVPQHALAVAQQPGDDIPAKTRQTRGKRIAGTIGIPSRASKRLKTTSRAGPEVTSSQSLSTERNETDLRSSETAISPSSDRHNAAAWLPEDLLRSATESAASVSEMANHIDSQIRLLRPRPGRNSTVEAQAESNATNPRRMVVPSSRAGRGRRRKTTDEQAAEIVANAIGEGPGAPRQRGVTPDDAAAYELEPSKVTMGDLCEDSKLGKKSVLETEMQENWAEIVQRRKEDRDRALLNAEKRRRKGVGQRYHPDPNQQPVDALAPAMAVVNGIIVVDQASREIDRSAQLQQAANQDMENVREDKNYYKYVNQSTVGIKAGHGQHTKWDDESTERFFKALRMFGTDFLMIANMFPGLSRKQIKTKFIREENADKARVIACLRNREPVELEEYAHMANKEAAEFHTLESIQKELDEQEKRLREEDNQRRKREGFATTNDVEGEATSTQRSTVDGEERQTESVEPGRFDTVAREIVEAAVAPKKRQRKINATTSKRGLKGGRWPEGGVEEILGSISEVAV